MFITNRFPFPDLEADVFRSTEKFKQFLDSDQVMFPQPALNSPPQSYSNWQQKWAVTKSVVLRNCFFLFSKCLHPFLSQQFPSLDRRMDVLLRYSIHVAESAIRVNHRNEKLLWRSINSYRSGTEGFLEAAPIPLRIRVHEGAVFKFSMHGELDFFSRTGLCSGMCDWLAYRYLTTLSHFPNPRDCIVSQAKFFEHGASHSSIILQSFGFAKEAILETLGLETASIDFGLSLGEMGIKTRFFQDEKNTCIEAFDKLEEGLYFLSLFERHKLLLIRTQRADFIFDPSKGCVMLDKNEFSANLTQRIEDYISFFDSRMESYFSFVKVSALPDNRTAQKFVTLEVERKR